MIKASNNPYPTDPDSSPSKLDRGGYLGNAQNLDEKINTNLSEAKALIESFKGSSFLGSIIPTDTPIGTEKSFWLATQAGTYLNHGGFTVGANSFAVISRNDAGIFSISQTPLDLTSYAKIVDTINTLTSTEISKPLSANQGRVLNDKFNDYVTDAEVAVIESNIRTTISSVSSGSPKGTYSNLAALQAAYPTGNSNIYVVTDNGHWYYYNVGWKDGGVYQSPLTTIIKSNESLSSAQRKGDVLYGILDQYTGEEITLSKVTGTQTVDNIIFFQLGTEYFKRNYIKLNLKWFNVKADGINNDVTGLALALSIEDDIFLEKGIYKLYTRLTIPSGKNLHSDSKYSTTIYGRININSNSKISNLSFMTDNTLFPTYDGNGVVQNTAQVNNVIFDNCIFEIRNTTTAIATLGIFTFDYGIDNLKLLNCYFTAPSISINALKFVSNLATNIIDKNITIDNCLFKNIGRMAIELYTIEGGDNTIEAIENINIKSCVFENIGIIVNSIDGMAISLAGFTFNSRITNNYFKNIKGIGIELVRYHTGTIISSNSFYKVNNGTISPITATLGDLGNGYITACNISDNTFTKCNGMYLTSINESVIKGNLFIDSTFGEIGGKNNFIVDNQISSLKTGQTTPFALNNLIKSNIKANRVITSTVSLTQLFKLDGVSIQNVFTDNDGMLLDSNYYVLANESNTVNKFSDPNTNIVLDNFKRSETGLNIVGDAVGVTWNLNNVTVNANSFVEYDSDIYTDYSVARKIFEVAVPCNLKGCIAVVYLTGMNSYKLRVTNPTLANITLNGESFPNASPASDLNWVWSVFIKYI